MVRRLPISEASKDLAGRRKVALCIGPSETAEEYRLLSAARSALLCAMPWLGDVINTASECQCQYGSMVALIANLLTLRSSRSTKRLLTTACTTQS